MNMKRNLILLIALLAGVWVYSQPTLKLYGYKQVIFPGTVPVRISEDGNQSAQVAPKARNNFFLYLAYPKSESIQPLQLWIRKKAYSVKVETIAKTPVEHVNRNIPARPVTTVLVPKTTQKVMFLNPKELTGKPVTPSAAAQKLIDTSELVLAYKWKGKTYYKALKELKELEPEMAE